MSDKSILFELKEKAKWSRDPEEKKAAIKELTTQGPNALPQLEEILNITAYEEIRKACAEAISSIRSSAENNAETPVTGDSSAETSSATPTKLQKKGEKDGEETPEGEIRLADLPP